MEFWAKYYAGWTWSEMQEELQAFFCILDDDGYDNVDIDDHDVENCDKCDDDVGGDTGDRDDYDDDADNDDDDVPEKNYYQVEARA